MHLTVLAASGATGRELVRQGIERGHTVTAIVRNPDTAHLRASPALTVVTGDVLDTASIERAVDPSTVVLSGLGLRKGDRGGTLLAGATSVIAAGPRRVIWLGAFGTGPSARAAGRLTTGLLRVVLRGEIPDKVAADAAVLAAGGTVFHAGPLSDKPLSPERRSVLVDDAPKRLFPASVGRATVAAAMIDEAENPRHPGAVVAPLAH